MDPIRNLIEGFGSATAVFAWSKATQQDLLSFFDLTDDQFDTLSRMADAEAEAHVLAGIEAELRECDDAEAHQPRVLRAWKARDRA